MHMVARRTSHGMQTCRSSWGITTSFTLHEKPCDQLADRMQPLRLQLPVPHTAAAEAHMAVRLCWVSPALRMHQMDLVAHPGGSCVVVARHPQAHNLAAGLKDLAHSLVIQVCGQAPDKGLPAIFWRGCGGRLWWTILNILEKGWLSNWCPSDARVRSLCRVQLYGGCRQALTVTSMSAD